MIVVFTSLSGLVAHSRDSRGDLDMMVALVCIIGLNDHTCGDKEEWGFIYFVYTFRNKNNSMLFY